VAVDFRFYFCIFNVTGGQHKWEASIKDSPTKLMRAALQIIGEELVRNTTITAMMWQGGVPNREEH
jgi:hypothetical protein